MVEVYIHMIQRLSEHMKTGGPASVSTPWVYKFVNIPLCSIYAE